MSSFSRRLSLYHISWLTTSVSCLTSKYCLTPIVSRLLSVSRLLPIVCLTLSVSLMHRRMINTEFLVWKCCIVYIAVVQFLFLFTFVGVVFYVDLYFKFCRFNDHYRSVQKQQKISDHELKYYWMCTGTHLTAFLISCTLAARVGKFCTFFEFYAKACCLRFP